MKSGSPFDALTHVASKRLSMLSVDVFSLLTDPNTLLQRSKASVLLPQANVTLVTLDWLVF